MKKLFFSLLLVASVGFSQQQPIGRESFKISRLIELVGPAAAQSIALSTLSDNSGTWLILYINKKPYILTAAHVAVSSLGELTEIPIYGLDGTTHIKKGEILSLQPLVSGLLPESWAHLENLPVREDYYLSSVAPGNNEKLEEIFKAQELFPLKISNDYSLEKMVFLPGFPAGASTLSIGKIASESDVLFDGSDSEILFDPEVEFLVNTRVSEGNSGGPVFDFEGRLLGIIVRSNGDSQLVAPAQSTHYARVVRIDYIISQILKHSELLSQEFKTLRPE